MTHRPIPAALVPVLVIPPAARAAPRRDRPPAVPGRCAFTTVTSLAQRLEDASTDRQIAGSGSAVILADGVDDVSHDQVPAVTRSRSRDRVMTRHATLPTHRPPGDRRGRWYTTAGLRPDEARMLPDAEHEGGDA